MSILVLTQTGGILKPFAIILGFIMNYIYRFLQIFGINNVYVGYQCADDSIDGQAAEVFEDVFFDEPRTSEGSEEVSEP